MPHQSCWSRIPFLAGPIKGSIGILNLDKKCGLGNRFSGRAKKAKRVAYLGKSFGQLGNVYYNEADLSTAKDI